MRRQRPGLWTDPLHIFPPPPAHLPIPPSRTPHAPGWPTFVHTNYDSHNNVLNLDVTSSLSRLLQATEYAGEVRRQWDISSANLHATSCCTFSIHGCAVGRLTNRDDVRSAHPPAFLSLRFSLRSHSWARYLPIYTRRPWHVHKT